MQEHKVKKMKITIIKSSENNNNNDLKKEHKLPHL